MHSQNLKTRDAGPKRENSEGEGGVQGQKNQKIHSCSEAERRVNEFQRKKIMKEKRRTQSVEFYWQVSQRPECKKKTAGGETI